MLQRKKRLVAFLPAFVALLVPIVYVLPLETSLRAAIMGFAIGVSLVGLAGIARIRRCMDRPAA